MRLMSNRHPYRHSSPNTQRELARDRLFRVNTGRAPVPLLFRETIPTSLTLTFWFSMRLMNNRHLYRHSSLNTQRELTRDRLFQANTVGTKLAVSYHLQVLARS